MPVNKAAHFRFEIIDECLRNIKKRWSKKDLLKYVNRRLELQFGAGSIISISQIRYDIENMQSEYGAPIELYRIGKSYYYRYEDENYSIKNIPVNEDEIQSLNVALNVLKQIKFFSIANDIEDIVKKLEARYSFKVEEQKEIIIFECSHNQSGATFLEDIYHAIKRKNVIKARLLQSRIKYHTIHPYLLKEYHSSWYLVGHCQETKKIIVLGLDQIDEVKVISLPYISDLFLNAENYFNHVVGISKPSDNIQRVRLLFDGYRAKQLMSNPLHRNQEIIKRFDNGSLEVELNVIINQELVDLLLSYGQSVIVLSPLELRKRISEMLRNMLECYASV